MENVYFNIYHSPHTHTIQIFIFTVIKQKHILCKMLHLPKTPEHICKSTKKNVQLKFWRRTHYKQFVQKQKKNGKNKRHSGHRCFLAERGRKEVVKNRTVLVGVASRVYRSLIGCRARRPSRSHHQSRSNLTFKKCTKPPRSTKQPTPIYSSSPARIFRIFYIIFKSSAYLIDFFEK